MRPVYLSLLSFRLFFIEFSFGKSATELFIAQVMVRPGNRRRGKKKETGSVVFK